MTAAVGAAAAPVATARGMRVGPLSRPTASGRPTGIDVSVYQHPHGRRINWWVVARHYRFVFIEATGGAAGWRSPYYRNDAAGARRAGLAVGAYSFADMRRPVGASARADARHFANVVGSQGRTGTLPPVLDVELNQHHLSRRQIVAWVRTWAVTVRARTGRTPIMYTYPNFWDRTVGGSTALSRSLPLWIAAFTFGYASQPTLPRGWGGWRFWQAAGGNGRAAGVPAACDLDVYNGSLRQLNHLALRDGPRPARRHAARPHPARHHRAARHRRPARRRHRAHRRHHARPRRRAAHHRTPGRRRRALHRHRVRRHHHRVQSHHHARHRAVRHAVTVPAAPAAGATPGTATTVTQPMSDLPPAFAAMFGLSTAVPDPSAGGLYEWLTNAVPAAPTGTEG